MDEIHPEIQNTSGKDFLSLYVDAGDLLKGSTEFPRIPEETQASYMALIDYYLLGVNRSYPALVRAYETQDAPPTKSLNTIKTWCYKYNWHDRIEEYENEVISKQLALVEKARLTFIGKQINSLYMMEKAIVEAASYVDLDNVSLASFTRAIERFTDTVQKVFDMTPTQRVDSTNNVNKFKSASESMNQLTSLNDLIKQREELKEIVQDEIEGSIIDAT